jgi:hypothetical protein
LGFGDSSTDQLVYALGSLIGCLDVDIGKDDATGIAKASQVISSGCALPTSSKDDVTIGWGYRHMNTNKIEMGLVYNFPGV